jgi:hypothetical protein
MYEMTGIKSMKKAKICAALVVFVCVATIATVSGSPLSYGKNYQIFSEKGITNPIYSGNTDNLKAGAHLEYPLNNAIIKHSLYYNGISSRPKFTLPVYYPTITPVPEQQNTGTSSSQLGGIIIRGTEGDWINMRSNFYNSSQILYDGRWHYHVGSIPVYWENMLLPGSYTLQIANKDTNTGYYCETVTVLPGQTVVLDVIAGMCPFCSGC